MKRTPLKGTNGAPEDLGVAIEAAAHRLFATRGYAGTSMRDLAKEVKISQANLYNYAASKEELLWRVNVRMLSQLVSGAETAMAASTCPVAQLANLMAAHVAYHAMSPRFSRLTKTELGHLIAGHRREVQGLRSQYERAFRSVIRRGGEAEVFDSTVERYAAFSMLEMGYGVGLWFQPDGELSLEEIERIYALLALRMVRCDWSVHARRCTAPDSDHLIDSAQAAAVEDTHSRLTETS